MAKLRFSSIGVTVFMVMIAGSLSCGPKLERKAMNSEQQGKVSCTLEADAITTNDVKVRLTISNDTAHAISIYRWNLPTSSEPEADLFEIRNGDGAVAYKGKMVKRKVTPEDSVAIDPSTSASVVVSLGKVYDVSAAGTYSIAYHSFNPYEEGKLQECRSNVLTVRK